MSHQAECFISLVSGNACGSPPSVSHSTVALSSVSTGSGPLTIATYTCDSANGYATRGNYSIACLTALGYNMWSPLQVSCVRKSTYIINKLSGIIFKNRRSHFAKLLASIALTLEFKPILIIQLLVTIGDSFCFLQLIYGLSEYRFQFMMLILAALACVNLDARGGFCLIKSNQAECIYDL